MDAANYEACGARLSQGDLVRAPIALFVDRKGLKNSRLLRQSGVLKLGDLVGAAMEVPQIMVGRTPPVLRIWHLPAVVVSPDCDLDKGQDRVLLAPILPLGAYDAGSQDAIRAGQYVSAFSLPPDPDLVLADGSRSEFPPSVVELRLITTVAPNLLAGQRMVALSAGQIDRLHEAWIRFIALRELSSTGSLDAVRGKRILNVSVVESSRKRHTVLLEVEDDVQILLYQEPRRAGPQVQSVVVSQGSFRPALVQALAGSDLVLRFENDEKRDWSVSCRQLGISPTKLKAASTTPLLIHCPKEPCEVELLNDRKRGEQLLLRIVE